MNTENTVIFLMGPTCSGKTALALELAQQFPIGLISVDSAQVYKGMDIGTAKPAPEILQTYPHALIDICEPGTPYNAADFCKDALEAIEQYQGAGKIPVLVGGTMMYFHALQYGLSSLPSATPDIRANITMQAQIEGWPALHAQLAVIDPQSAAKIKPNDAQRISRALEVYRMTGQPLSELQNQPQTKLSYPLHVLGLMPGDRARLHQDITQRFDQMLAQGFIDEARTLFITQGLDPALPALKSVGYRQAYEYVHGRETETMFREKVLAATRQLAKRQMTWLRSWDPCKLYDPHNGDDRARLIQELCSFLPKI